MNRLVKRLALVLLVVALFIGAAFTNAILNIAKDGSSWKKERMSVIITSPDAKPFLLGFDTVLGDFVWIKTVLYFGAQYQGDRDFEWLKSMITSVLMLNPRFFPAYEFAALMVPQVTGDYEFAREVCEKGIGRIGDREERVMFYLAYIYYTEYKDYNRAADLLSMASYAPYAPPFWGQFASTLYGKSGNKDNGLFFLKALYETTDNPQIKDALSDKIKNYGKDGFKIYEK